MAILGSKNSYNQEKSKEVFHFPTSKNALIIFTRNPELGKCKTRLAATVGDKAALDIYTFLLNHTANITSKVNADAYVYYSEKVRENDLWDDTVYKKKKQEGADLGNRMEHAFNECFQAGYQRVIIIGSDMYDLETKDINNAFEALKTSEVVLGPAEDGGYYLLGMTSLQKEVFHNKAWGTSSVLKETLKDVSTCSVTLLTQKNDIDFFEDLKDIPVFQQFLQKNNTTND